MKGKTDKTVREPLVYSNWRRWLADGTNWDVYESPILSDSFITGEMRLGFGPYQVLNGGVFVPALKQEYLYPVVLIRFPLKFWTSTGDERGGNQHSGYRGGSLPDEIAALLSLVHGVRFSAGSTTRRFVVGGDPLGSPTGAISAPVVFAHNRSAGLVLPLSVGTCAISDDPKLSEFATLTPQSAVALVVTARCYQSALLIAESQPELAWLLFVSAIESAAIEWRAQDSNSLEVLKRSMKKLHDLVLTKGEDFAAEVADILAPMLGSTRRFVNFLMRFGPDSPNPLNPSPFYPIDWEAERRKKAYSQIYDWRSQALHCGTPFPELMCQPPHIVEEGYGYNERPVRPAWDCKGMPMLLHVFEYVVRTALINWWANLPSEAGQSRIK